jgi:hypothetical protein
MQLFFGQVFIEVSPNCLCFFVVLCKVVGKIPGSKCKWKCLIIFAKFFSIKLNGNMFFNSRFYIRMERQAEGAIFLMAVPQGCQRIWVMLVIMLVAWNY